jgi:hypothetical protein
MKAAFLEAGMESGTANGQEEGGLVRMAKPFEVLVGFLASSMAPCGAQARRRLVVSRLARAALIGGAGGLEELWKRFGSSR